MAQKQTPLMAQYHDIKSRYTDLLVFFQVGDFYELFYEDAQKAAQFLGITLTKRGKDNGIDIPLCGVPVHTVKHYLTKLIKGGFSVVIVDQLEEAKPGVLVKRGVTQVLTPGTLTEESFLDEKSASYVCSISPEQDNWALVFAELLTAQLYATTCKAGDYKVLETELARFSPDEVIVKRDAEKNAVTQLLKKEGYFVSLVSQQQSESFGDGDRMRLDQTLYEKLQSVHTAKKELEHALDLFFSYMNMHHPHAVSLFNNLHMYASDDFLMLDHSTQHNLELLVNTYDGTRAHSLYSVLDVSVTGMGARTMRKWLVRPLLNKQHIEQRYDVVQYYQERYVLLQETKKFLAGLGDLERVIGRMALDRASYQDYKHLLHACLLVCDMRSVLSHELPLLLDMIKDACNGFDQLTTFLQHALYDEDVYDWRVKIGFDKELDQLRSLMLNSQQALLEFEQEEQRKTGINSLKVRYNNLHGYYIEITKANTHLVPERYEQRHSLVGKDRYTNQELQLLEQRITSAQQDAQRKEEMLYQQIKNEVARYIPRLRRLAHMLGQWDALLAFAHNAVMHHYVRPQLVEDAQDFFIKEGRHPVIEHLAQGGFVANDTTLTNERRMWIITGPNMGGKSTYLRQVALINIMAQIGSFVPAQQASLPILDRIFTRIGAGDNVASGKSTFLVEMEETADICHYATDKSLVILDEVGRGTSTQDGVALAQAIVEYLYQRVRPWCLFATHYHELTHLATLYPGIATYYTASQETEQGIVFLHRLVPGRAHKSFGLEVARRAHLPAEILKRAQELVLHENESVMQEKQESVFSAVTKIHELQDNIACLQKQVEVLQHLEEIDLLELTPKKAFDLIWQLKKQE